MNSELFLSLLLVHIIGDFYLQTDKYCRQKESKKLKSWFLYAHGVIIGALSWIINPCCDFIFYAVLIAASHFIIDTIKVYSPKGLMNFVIDQILHIAIICTISYIYEIDNDIPIKYLDFLDFIYLPYLLLAVLLCMKPANILIKLILERYQVGESESCNNIKNAGALIGNLERILTIVFVLIGQYEAIGFIVAAKSILRFKDTDTAKTEYVLAGTFLSFGIAILCGLLALL